MPALYNSANGGSRREKPLRSTLPDHPQVNYLICPSVSECDASGSVSQTGPVPDYTGQTVFAAFVKLCQIVKRGKRTLQTFFSEAGHKGRHFLISHRPEGAHCVGPDAWLATTTPTPLPRVTAVPLNNMQGRSPMAQSASTAATVLSTATDSPVKADSSADSLKPR
jgi:hypothetical protein